MEVRERARWGIQAPLHGTVYLTSQKFQFHTAADSWVPWGVWGIAGGGIAGRPSQWRKGCLPPCHRYPPLTGDGRNPKPLVPCSNCGAARTGCMRCQAWQHWQQEGTWSLSTPLASLPPPPTLNLRPSEVENGYVICWGGLRIHRC